MYKKITHTIVEEHFDNTNIVNGNNAEPMPMRFRITPTAEIISETLFKTKVEDALLDINLRWLGLLEASYNKSLDYESAIEEAYLNIDTLGNSLKGYYGVEFTQRFNQMFRAAITNLMYIWRNESVGWDNTIQRSRLFDLLTPGASTLFTQYNQLWQREAIDEIFNDLFNAYINLGSAFKSGDVPLQSAVETELASVWNRLATTISSGVIQQFPAYFTA